MQEKYKMPQKVGFSLLHTGYNLQFIYFRKYFYSQKKKKALNQVK